MTLNLRLLSCLFISLMLVSCASTEKQAMTENAAKEEAGLYKYDAWRLKNTTEFEAINVLLDESDMLIDTDKLERVLRIKPNYAPAWSRLSWLALQMNSPKRSVQMAKRSNSFAFSNPELQSLNWSFIRAASKSLNDEESYHQANQKIESLKVF